MAKIFGGNCTLWRAVSASVGETVFVRVPQVTDLASSGGESEMIDSTNRDDLVAAKARVQQPGLIAALSVDFSVQFDMDLATHLEMVTDAEAQVERNFQVRSTVNTNRAKFRGFQKALPQTWEMAGIVMARTGVACSTRITYSA